MPDWGGVARRVVGEFEERTGLALRSRDRLDLLETRSAELSVLKEEASELALHSLDYLQGRPQEMQVEKRRRLAQRARVAFTWDPLAGREVEMLADFAFGKGISRPQARDEAVQKVIDDAWTDPGNMEELTSFEAQRVLSNDLRTSANIFVLLFESGGRIRVATLDTDTVTDVVPDPEYRKRALYYVSRTRKYRWDFQNDRPAIEDEMKDTGLPVVHYFEHWRNVEDAIREREESEDELEDVPVPPEGKRGRGKVFHLRINRLGEQHFGTSPFARSLRFYSAMNQFTESRVAMAQAAATFVARRAMKGTPKTILKAATSILGQTGELGTITRDPGDPETPQVGPGAPGAPPIPPGSWWTGNEADRLESMNLQSGGVEAASDVQIIRAPIAASSGFGQHYLGDASNTNLATATTLELPVLMMVSAWQEIFEQMYRWFTDRAIEAAVRAGKLGGIAAPEAGGKPLSELHLQEAEDIRQIEERTGKDLSYEFTMPYPGRRNLPDVLNWVTQLCTAFDPNGVNVPFRRTMLRFAFSSGMELDDVGRAVEESIPDDWGSTPEPAPGGGGGGPATRDPRPSDDKSQHGERRRGQRGEDVATREEEWLPAELRVPVAQFAEGSGSEFQSLVGDAAVLAAASLASVNGSR